MLMPREGDDPLARQGCDEGAAADDDPGPDDDWPGGDAYHHHATPVPPDAYLNPGAPVIPEEYRNPDAGRPRRDPGEPRPQDGGRDHG